MNLNDLENIDPKATVQVGKMLLLMQAMAGAELDVDQRQQMMIHSTVNGLLSKDQRVPLSDEEREKKAAVEMEKDELRQMAFNWLSTHDGPSYNGARETGRSIGELIKLIGLPANRPNLDKLIRPVLESELTGWGKVGVHEKVAVYAKKAILIGFTPRAATPPAPAVESPRRDSIA